MSDPQVFAGPVGEQLHRRVQNAIVAASRAAGVELEPAADDIAALRALIGTLTDRLAVGLTNGPDRDHAAALERLLQRFERRADALARAQAAVAKLRELTVPSTMLDRAPAALCESSTLRRAILSVVREGKMVAQAAHFTGEPSAAGSVVAQLRDVPIVLEHPLIETELLRRRRATIVLDAHVHPRVDRRMATLMRWRSYVAAPLLVGVRVIGVIHADRGPDDPVDVVDRDLLWEFATGLAQAYESASLRRTLFQEREQMRHFLEWVGARSSELTDAPITLAAAPRVPLPPLDPLDGPAPPEGRDDRVVFAGLLTRRELDVLRLLADGRTNKAIADALVLSDATVKFHTGSILRKLHVANRAEAVSRYLTLLGMRAP